MPNPQDDAQRVQKIQEKRDTGETLTAEEEKVLRDAGVNSQEQPEKQGEQNQQDSENKQNESAK